VTGGILGEIKARSATLMQLADWASFTSVFILFTLYMLYQVGSFIASSSSSSCYIPPRSKIEENERKKIISSEVIL
jgi:hypothetical protein